MVAVDEWTHKFTGTAILRSHLEETHDEVHHAVCYRVCACVMQGDAILYSLCTCAQRADHRTVIS